MIRGLWLVAVAFWLAVAGAVVAQPREAEAPAPWHLQSVARLGHARPTELSAPSSRDDRLPYLHLHLKFRPEVAERKLHQFRITDAKGQTVAEVAGFHGEHALLVFEGQWKNLAGLYLEGLGHREPLFTTATAAKTSPRNGIRDTTAGSARGAEGPWEVDPPLEDHPSDFGPARISVANATPRGIPDREANATREAPSRGKNAGADATGGTSGKNAGEPSREGRGVATGASSGSGAGGGAGVGAGLGGRGSGTLGAEGEGGLRLGMGSGAGSGFSGPSDRPLGSGGASTTAGSGEAGPPGPQRLARTALPGGIGAGRGSGIGGGSGSIHLRERRSDAEFKSPPPLTLYLSCTDEFGRGRIYQVNEYGSIYGLVTLPYAATGLAIHRRPALAAAVPRDGGKIYGIDVAGRVSVILENDPLLPQPVDVGIAGNSDTIVVADNLAHLLAGTSMAGEKAREFRRFASENRDRPAMCVAVTPDKHVLLATEMGPGVYRFPAGDFSPRAPVLPRWGGVAADAGSLCWAAVQPPDQVVLFDGDALAKTLHLPTGQTAYRQGLLSFAPAARVIVAAQATDKARDGVWFVELPTASGSPRNLFVWRKEPVLDFVVGPRMPWEPYELEKQRGLR